MPTGYPKSHKGISEELDRIIESLTKLRGESKELGAFFDEWENLYFQALGKKGEKREIRFTTLYLIWCQMMAVIKEERNK